MPIHDWSRIDADLFHDFHQTWSIAIRNALNSGLLPQGYSALVEQHAGGLVPHGLAVQRKSRSRPIEPPAGLLTATPPKTRLVVQASQALAARANRVVIRHRLGEVVCVIEIVSPGNKGSRAARRAFVDKTHEFLRQGIHLLVIDLLTPTPRDPGGIHKAIWDEFEEERPFELPSDKPLTLAAYVAGDLFTGIETTAYVEFVGVGDALPDMPAYLDRSGYVAVPLEATYQSTWASCPSDMRELVETGKLSDELD